MLPPVPSNVPVAATHTHAPASQAAAAPPWMRAHKLQLLLNQLAARGLGQGTATGTLLPLQLDAQAWAELQAMQAAVWQRLQQQQQGWMRGWAALAQDYNQARQVNTLSKFVEQEYNFTAQFGALIADQASKLANLLENIQVDYGYWIAQQQEGAA